MHAPISFFEETPSGRILSRMSADLSIVDIQLAQFLDHGVSFVAQLLQISGIIVLTAPPMAAVLVLAAGVYVMDVLSIERSSRELKRLANNAQSPVLSLLGEAFQGRLLLRAMRCDDAFEERFQAAVDNLQALNYSQTSVIHWGMFMSYFISAFISSITALWMLSRRVESNLIEHCWGSAW